MFNSRSMCVPFAIVHHANQFLITEGYENRHGLRATLGSVEDKTGFAWILELHRSLQIPVNLHFSGTLLEAIAWHQPEFLSQIQELHSHGLLELVGSCYGQNIMRFFGYEHNLRQLDEQLRLYQIHLHIDPAEVKVFWPPERVWDTERMAPVLTDPRLPNHGYRHLLVDDRLLLPVDGTRSPRFCYDREPGWRPELFQICPIEHGQGLRALPIAYNLRQNIPPADDKQWQQVLGQLRWLSDMEKLSSRDLIAIYGDDLEKTAGVGSWNQQAIVHYETLLRWLGENGWVQPVRLSEHCALSRPAEPRKIETGTFIELANHFGAGEGYENWFFDSQWSRYRAYFSWTQNRVNELSLLGADEKLIDLAQKHLMVSTWECAWHTPREGAFGDPDSNGHPSPWIKAVASHSRHAAVMAEAAFWMRHRDGNAHAYLEDVDGDGDQELVLKNDKLMAVLSPRWGGRLVALFSVDGRYGSMVIGNPSDDWNWCEELNRYMEVPANHPGALTDVGFEHDAYEAQVLIAEGPKVLALLHNRQSQSRACDLRKELSLVNGENALVVEYTLPPSLPSLMLEFGFSPDYLNLLRHGRPLLRESVNNGTRACSANGTSVWVKSDGASQISWSQSSDRQLGHVVVNRMAVAANKLKIQIGVQSS
jgi:starch synthase